MFVLAKAVTSELKSAEPSTSERKSDDLRRRISYLFIVIFFFILLQATEKSMESAKASTGMVKISLRWQGDVFLIYSFFILLIERTQLLDNSTESSSVETLESKQISPGDIITNVEFNFPFMS